MFVEGWYIDRENVDMIIEIELEFFFFDYGFEIVVGCGNDVYIDFDWLDVVDVFEDFFL